MKIEKVHILNLDAIFSLTKSCAKHLIENGIFQWNEDYPSKEILKNDIEGTSHQIHLSPLQRGVYFITLRSKDFVTTRKIMKF